MLYYKIQNYEDFKKCFGTETRENGVTTRKNKILLGHLKNPLLLRYCQEHGDYRLLHISDMADLQKKVTEAVKESGRSDERLANKVELIGETYHSALYRTDGSKGVCEDMDKSSVRYVNVERNRTFKMKSGKFMRALILETEIGKLLSPGILNWLSGDVFTQRWHTYTYGHTSSLELHVDCNFEKIYNSNDCDGDFGSCMTDRDRERFYTDSVNAKAAYITNEHGFVVVRAILFTDVTDRDGKKWRLLERQYAADKDDTLKRLLIDRLIQGGHIDGYKVVGASCNDADAFVDIDGNSLREKKFEIDCRLRECDTLFYQDSFKWYNYNKEKAYNYEPEDYSHELDTTDRNIHGDEDGEEWDEYHQYYCPETQLCYRNGREIYVDSNNLEDFVWIESIDEYHHDDDCMCCSGCKEWLLSEDALYSDITDEEYCCEQCMQEAETRFKHDNWYYSEYDEEWFEKVDDITLLYVWVETEKKYKETSISTDTLDKLIEDEQVWEFDKEAFDTINPDTNLPYGYKLTKETKHEYTTVKETV